MSAGHPTITPAVLRRWLDDGEELALLDVREQAAHAYEGHPLLSVSLPWHAIADAAPSLLPRRSVRTVIFDDGEDTLARRAADRLAALGYSDLWRLQGGTEAWRRAGRELFTGTNVFSKVFGEVVERESRTPRIGPAQLRRLAQAGEVVLIDSRPADEYERMHIAGALHCPAAELPLRIDELAPDPAVPVVITCAGRTRGIIGAQALRNAGVPRDVRVLDNGTMGWLLDGQALVHGEAAPRVADPSPQAREQARARSASLAVRYGLSVIHLGTLADFRADASRSLYVFDVRSAEEYAAGHLPGARSAPGTQLVMFLEDFVGARNARVVLVDGDDAARGAITASWLQQMGWAEVHLLPVRPSAFTEQGAAPAAPPPAGLRWVSPYLLPDEAERRRGFEAYLQWSAGLIAQYERDGTHRFRIPTGPLAIHAGGPGAGPLPSRPASPSGDRTTCASAEGLS